MQHLNRALAALVSAVCFSCGGSPDPSPDGTTGSLFVDSRPEGASAFLDDVAEGFTPMTITNVDVGDHTLRVELPGHAPFVEDITIVAGDNTPVMAELVPTVAETGFLAVTTDPPELDGVPVVADVVLNGEPAGLRTNGRTAAMVEVDTSVGHDVTVSFNGFLAVEQPDARCDPGSRVDVVVPIGADVDGRFRGSMDGRTVEVVTSIERGRIRLLVVRAGGYAVRGRELYLSADNRHVGSIAADHSSFHIVFDEYDERFTRL